MEPFLSVVAEGNPERTVLAAPCIEHNLLNFLEPDSCKPTGTLFRSLLVLVQYHTPVAFTTSLWLVWSLELSYGLFR